ncbi:AMP-binding protein [Agrococcus baldri]|uniref:ATP-dependent acyl-CoA ligase n=1 Tax=Agrococcus baldri TaxID=153730 RepID=A0AA87UR34_9MICO|nr:AMP-binding protein [Agrococcus baldri]GEK79110.1 ATP-dependent acyl-CoA ligase [Agrococcus baldri]
MNTAIDLNVHESILMRGTGDALGHHVTDVPFGERSLVHVLARQAAERPDKEWLIFDSTIRLTFSQVYSLTNRFARAALASVGDKPRVALYLRNQPEFVPAFLGAQAAGGASVPLNPELKGQLLGELLSKAEAQILVVRGELLEHIEALQSLGPVRQIVYCGEGEFPAAVHGVPVSRYEEFIADSPDSALDSLPLPAELGALMFTSGTSGGSKAAMCTNHYLFFYPGTVADSLGLTPEDVLSTPLQICHVAALHVLAMSSLHAGCTVHLKTRFSASSYWQDIAKDGATFSMLMGTMAGMILKSTPEAPPHSLRHLYTIPQPVEREEFERRYRTTVLWQGYGSTEGFPLLPKRERLEGVPADTIGPPPQWVDFGVVDEFDRLVAPEVKGEIVYRPLVPFGMSSGYYNDPTATQHAFRNFTYHTGDIGYYDEAGNVHFSMRNRDAIRRHGENVSAVEVERIALTYAAILDAAAYAVPGDLGEHEVKLDFVAEDRLDLAEVQQWLKSRLPRYMVPRYLEQRESLPKTVSDRVEKYKLMDQPLDRPEVYSAQP